MRVMNTGNCVEISFSRIRAVIRNSGSYPSPRFLQIMNFLDAGKLTYLLVQVKLRQSNQDTRTVSQYLFHLLLSDIQKRLCSWWRNYQPELQRNTGRQDRVDFNGLLSRHPTLLSGNQKALLLKSRNPPSPILYLKQLVENQNFVNRFYTCFSQSKSSHKFVVYFILLFY